jgi:hypothetical protein
MAHQAYTLTYDARQLPALKQRLGLEGDTMAQLGGLVRQVGLMAQAQAVYNVSGYPVNYSGGFFRVNVRTGALKASISLQYPSKNQLTARVYVTGSMSIASSIPGLSKPRPVSDYAGAVEWGHKQVDLKRTMQGKIVPFFGSVSKANGPYAATGLLPVDIDHDFGDPFASPEHIAKLAAKGKPPMYFIRTKASSRGNSSYYISFRRVGKTGWIIPRAKPRPFMRASGEQLRDKGKAVLTNGIAKIMRAPA